MLCEEILERQKIGMSGTVDELLHLAELARAAQSLYRSARIPQNRHDARCHRPEPYYQLGELSELDGESARGALLLYGT